MTKNNREKEIKDLANMSFGKRDNKTWVKTGKRLLDYYYGRYNKGTASKTRYVVNSTYQLVNTILPNFIINQPYLRVKPKNTKYYKASSFKEGEVEASGYEQINNIKAAITGEAVINAHYSRNKLIFENRKAIQDALFYPFGIVKNGIRYEEGEDGKVTNDEPYLERVNPLDFGWHPMATSLDSSEVLFHRIVQSKSKLRKMFGNVVDDLTNEIPEHYKSKIQNDSGKDSIPGYVTVIECHDQENQKIYYLAGGSNKVIGVKDNELWFNGSHFDMIKFAGDNDKMVGIPMLLMVEDQMIALNEIFTLMYEHLKKFPGQVFVDKDAADDDQIKRMQNGEQGSIHVVMKSEKIKFTNPLMMGGDYFNSFKIVDDIIAKTLGIPDFTSLAGTNRKSASEASFIQGDATVRRNYFLNIVKDFVLSSAEKQFSLIQEFMDDKEVIKATGELNHQTFVANKEDIQGEFMFDFDVDSMAAINVAELQNLTQLLQIQASNEVLHPTLKKLNPDKLARYLYKKGGVNIDMFATNEVDELVVLDPEKENQIAESGKLMPRPKEGEDHDYHLKVHKDFIKLRIQKLGPDQAQGDYAINQIIEHIALTEMIKSGAPEPQVGQQAPTPNMMAPSEALTPEGPQGPMQQNPSVPETESLPQ